LLEFTREPQLGEVGIDLKTEAKSETADGTKDEPGRAGRRLSMTKMKTKTDEGRTKKKRKKKSPK